MAALDGATLHGIKDLQARHDLSGRKHLNLELVLAQLGDPPRHEFASAIERIERLRPAHRHSPFYIRCGLRKRRGGDCCVSSRTSSDSLHHTSSVCVALHRTVPPPARSWSGQISI